MAGWGNDDEEITDDGGSFGAGDELVEAPARRGGTSTEMRRSAGGQATPSASRPLPDGVKPSEAGAGRGVVNPMPAAVRRADAPLADRAEAVDDAVDRIELGAPAEQVFGAFARMGVSKDEIIARGRQLGGKAFAGGPGDLTPAAAPPADPVGSVTAVEPGTLEGVSNFGKRVAERGSQAATGALASAGVITPESAAASLSASQKRMEAAAPGSDIARGMEAFGRVKTFGDAFRAIADNPAATGVVVAESAALILPIMAVAAFAGLPAAGTAAVAGGVSGALEFGSALTDMLGDKGIDARDVGAVEKALKDPAFMAEVRKKGAIRGLSIGSIDALTAGMAGRFIEPVMMAAKTGQIGAGQAARQAATAATKELSMQMAGGAGGEALAQALTGENKPFDVVIEALAEGVGAPTEVASNVRGAGRVAGAMTPEAQFARALGQDVDSTFFKAKPIVDYARAALNPQAFDPSRIDPTIQADQLAAERAQSTQPDLLALRNVHNQAIIDSGQYTDDELRVAGVTPAAPAVPVVPRVEDMPTTPLAPEQIVALATQARAAAAAQGLSSDVAAAAPKGDAAPGVAQIRQGSLAAASEQVLRANAQASTVDNGGGNVSSASPAGELAAGGRAAAGGDTVGGVAGAGRAAAVTRRGGADAALAAPAAAAPAPARDGTIAQGALNATNQTTGLPQREGSRAAGTAGGDADIRREFSARYEQQRASQLDGVGKLRNKADGLRKAGTPELIQQAEALERRAQLLEMGAENLPVMSMPPRKLAGSFSSIQTAIESTFGRRVVAYYDTRDTAGDGFAEDGVAFVNLARPERSVAFTAFHELQHLVRKEAEAGNAKSRAATQMLDQVWAMIDTAAKRQYAERYLFRNAIEAGAMTPEQALNSPKLRDEMLSDFMGKRATDERFMRQLAEKNPSQFRAFATRWVEAIKGLIESLKGTRIKDDELDVGGLKDLDRAIANLERAKLVAEKVLQAWADSKPQQAEASLATQISLREAGNRLPDDSKPAPVATNPAPKPKPDGVRSMSEREDKNELGAFDPFSNLDDIKTIDTDQAPEVDGEARPLSAAELEEINAELQAEQAWADTERPVYDHEGPSDETLASAGVMAESAYQPLPYRRDDSTDIRFSQGGTHYHFRLFRSDLGVSAMPSESAPGPGAAMGLRFVSEAAAEAYNRRVAASLDLTRRGFDLYTAVPSAARTRVQKTWQTIAGMKGAFEFKKGDPMAYKGKPPVESFNAIAREMLAGTRLTMRAEKSRKTGWYEVLIIERKPDGLDAIQKVEIEYVGGADPRLTMHVIGLNKGSGIGKAFYQVAFAWGHMLGIKSNADRFGLTSVNTYRRTEQMMAAAARAGEAGAVNPGTGQRVYGWNARAKDATQRARNLVRLALASARNAAEMVPGVRDLAYSLTDDTFSWRRGPNKGEDAEAFVTQSLRDKDVRTLSVSRSTLARAAVTFAAVDNELKIDESATIKSPILYSARGDGGEYAAVADPFADGYKALDGRVITFAATVASTGKTATVTIDSGAYMRDIDRRLQTLRRIRDCLT